MGGTSSSSRASARICLLDPNAVSRDRTTQVLAAAGCDVTAVRSAAEASEHAATSPFAVVVFDVSLPMSERYASVTLHGLSFGGFTLVLFGDRAPADLERLARAHGARHVRKTRGAGLLVAELAELLPGAGIRGDAVDEGEEAPCTDRSSGDGAPIVRGGRGPRPSRVLLMDDSEVALSVIQDRLKDVGLDVRIAVAVGELDSITRGWAPDVIVTDVDMPEMRGDALCARLKAHLGMGARVVLCSSLSDEELERLAKASGADAFVSKSRGVEQVVARIRDVCASYAEPPTIQA